MWQADSTSIANGRRYVLKDNNGPISFQDLFLALSDDLSFANWYTDLLAASEFPAFFWEHPSLTNASISQQAQFVTIDAPELAKTRADSITFEQQFSSATPALTAVFENLGRNAVLVTPCAGDDAQSCAHLATFVRNATAARAQDFWRTLGRTVLTNICDRPLWLSTSGLGVSWLHVRLDSKPKYYQHGPYTTM